MVMTEDGVAIGLDDDEFEYPEVQITAGEDVDDGEDEAEDSELSEWHRRRASVPHADLFEDEEYLEAPALEEIAQRVIETHSMDAGAFDITVLWKKKGGKSKGKEVWGQCQKVTGLTRFFASGTQAVIWIAADHCSAYEVNNYFLEALIHHELLHIVEDEDDDGASSLRIRGHDVEGFAADLTTYGLFSMDYRRMSTAFQQAALIDDDLL